MLVAELVKLNGMAKQTIWRQALDNQEVKNKIQRAIEQIDGRIMDFQVPFFTCYSALTCSYSAT